MNASETNADPHVACRHRLLTAYAWFVAARPIEGSSNPTSSAHHAAQAVNSAKRREVARIFALPAPETLDGLRVFGLALALSLEGTSVEGDTDVAAACAILSATQEKLPPGFIGFGDEPDYDDRDRAAWTGSGSLPAWAQAGKAAPDDADFLVEARA
ncbi:hypothetical protein [Methylobacterium platani]|uniref:Uncharacterized protein n=2 Tax=Methylobacterium platani TaxID=427683 RepID=A0A179S554_9HYPH|nr:hypothetical protein [Methylobacterium platani]KMO20632.1 hypothetical protein SQ03_05210 [Methylobacterium platani JCM 14648]OAS22217.1 hypothetical protein A5481_19815 [Methylobacterium platani]